MTHTANDFTPLTHAAGEALIPSARHAYFNLLEEITATERALARDGTASSQRERLARLRTAATTILREGR